MGAFFRYVFLAILLIGLFVAALWAGMALWFKAPYGPVLAGVFGLVALISLAAFLRRPGLRSLSLFAPAFTAVVVWWVLIPAPQDGNWAPDVARQVTGTLDGDILTLTDVRNFTWHSPDDFDEAWETRSYDLSQLVSTDLIMSYWSGPYIGHQIVSFGFADGSHLAWSVEIRREIGGTYSPVADMFKANTLVIIAADERDVIGTRTNVRQEDVHLFRTNGSPELARATLIQIVALHTRLGLVTV